MNIALSDSNATSPGPGFLRREKRRILIYSITALASVALVAVLVTAYVQYRVAFEQSRSRLEEIVKGRARLIEAVERFDAHTNPDYPGGPEKATLNQILSAHEHFSGFGKTGEFTLARRQGDQIHFLLNRRHNGDVTRETVSWKSDDAEPMRRALQGQTGNLIGLDYRGVRVLAAHEPVDKLGWGIVAKIDVAEIRSSFIRSGLVALGLSLLVIAMGVAILIRITSPIIQRLEERTRELHLQMTKRTQAEQQLAEARSLLLASIEETGRKLTRVEGAQASYFRAIALDYDGTLAESGRPGNDLLNALQELRRAGQQLVLMTGRIMAELRREFVDVGEWFDLIVTENGAEIWHKESSRALAPAVPTEIDNALRRRRVPYRRGRVIVACDGRYADVVLEELERLQLDSQIVRNRGAIMILPAGISKGTGLSEGLGLLGISPHNTIAVGDAENDLSLLEHCELTVAVANAVPSLKAQADVVLDEAAAEGVMQLLHHPILRGDDWVESKRWKLRLGHTPEGDVVTLPASQINILITGGSGGGKSYSAGLIAEQLIEMGYSVCVFDPEGDYVGLSQLPGVSLVGGHHLPAPEELFNTQQRPLGSIIIDLTSVPFAERQSYMSEALPVLKRQRELTGTPHWIFVDEAHEPFSVHTIASPIVAGEKGYCLITYQPKSVQADTRMSFDFVLAVPSGEQATEVAEMVGAFTHFPVDALERFLKRGARRGQSLLIRVSSLEVSALIMAPRALTHVRHVHKYASSSLPPNDHFVFRNKEGLTGARAGNIEEFHRELQGLATDSLLHHVRCHDFSRWIQEAMQDGKLVEELFTIESRASDPDSSIDVEKLRRDILAAIHGRYLK